MLRLTRHEQHGDVAIYATLKLPFDIRQKSRFRAMLENGEQVGVIVPRGKVLRDGDLLISEEGRVVQVRAADESVSIATAQNTLLLARASYHLGNRHVPLQIGDCWLRYLTDHVLDDMLASMGLVVTKERAAFEPEAGAYAAHHPPSHEQGVA